MNLKNKTILITGGTGTFGQVMVKNLLKIKGVKKIIIYSRDEFKQHQMRGKFKSKILRFFYWGHKRQIKTNNCNCRC